MGGPFLKVYTVSGNAEALAKTLNSAFKTSGSLTISAISPTSIAVWGDPQDHIDILKQIGSTRSNTETKLLALKGSDDAARTVELLKEVFPESRKGNPFFAADTKNNVILVRGTHEQVATIMRSLTTYLDKTSSGSKSKSPDRTGFTEYLWPQMAGVQLWDDKAGLNSTPEDQENSRLHNWINSSPRPLVYQRPSIHRNSQTESDLAGFAPGLNTTHADVMAVLEAEVGLGTRPAAGTIDPAAGALIDKARQAGWQTVTIPGQAGQSSLRVVFDGSGRYVYERVLDNGLRERVVCDSNSLWHLYPELAIGSRRPVNEFRRRGLTALIPWAMPPAQDLANGMDVRHIAPRTVALIPTGVRLARERGRKIDAFSQLQLTFAEDGRLAEKCLVAMPMKKTLYRETYDAAGTVKYGLGSDGKAMAKAKLALAQAAAPNLKPDLKRLVVVPMPLRARDHLLRAAKDKDNVRYEKLDADTAIALIATDSFSQNGRVAQEVFARRFHSRGDKRLGFYTLLASNEFDLDSKEQPKGDNKELRFEIGAEHPKNPFGGFARFAYDEKKAKLIPMGGPAEGFVQQLAAFRHVYERWTSGQAARGKKALTWAAIARDLAVVRRIKSPLLHWELLDVMQDNYQGDDPRFQRALGDAYLDLKDHPELGYAARYEHARSLATVDNKQARKLFKEIHAEALREGVVPPIDLSFLQAFSSTSAGNREFADLMRKASARLIAAKHRAAVFSLARQCNALDDPTLADHLVARAFAGTAGKERKQLSLLAIRYWCATQHFARADALLQPLLKDKALAGHSQLWRLAAFLAGKRGMVGRAAVCLEKALEIEYCNLPAVINLRAVREDYGTLLNHYETLAVAAKLLEKEPSPDFQARVVRAADRWRPLDNDGTAACQAAGRILQTLGAHDLAWDYDTTPLSQKPFEADPWLILARQLRQDGDLASADKAFALAFEAEPTNAQILWDRAELLQEMGKSKQARKIYRQIADGTWQPRFSWIQRQAREMVVGENGGR
jgi:tetratricopeptide (TPR) repeat protein